MSDVFRIIKNSNYTVMSNYHLRDKNLSLKAKGLLSIILSLPEEWDYTQKGLAYICKEGIDGIRSALKELESCGYLKRERERDANGRMRGTNYEIYEMPQLDPEEPVINQPSESKSAAVHTKKSAKTEDIFTSEPISEEPTWEVPRLENPTLEKPRLESPTQLNKDILNTNVSNTELKNKEKLNTEDNCCISSQISSIYPSRQMDEARLVEQYNALRERLKEQVGYDYFVYKNQQLEKLYWDQTLDEEDYLEEVKHIDLNTLDSVIIWMLDILAGTSKKSFKIDGEDMDREIVKQKLLRANMPVIKNVITALNTMEIRNPKRYAISMICNAV